ncbi:ABC transporter ATP-binding protein [Streptomyces sp. NPDC051976]|uniref:ABC transporter ATP-binding protein n=1 Tax=Streptomyces sp. NPDC051976 TaxID=3154947 RepID=UPI00343572DE
MTTTDDTRPAAAAEPLLRVRDLKVVIGGRHILHGVDLDVAPAGVTALLGRNGAGKTTTVRGVLGLVPRTGSVRFAGEETVRLATHTLVRRGIGYAPEDRGVFAALTVAENLRLAERRDAGEPAYALVHELFPELRQRARQAAGTLSGGQQQMVAIARTLLNGNRLIIADEPTKGLAPRVVTEVARVLERAARAVPVLLVEQNLAVVRRLAEHCVVLADGRTAYRGPAAELLGDTDAARRLLGVARHTEPTAAATASAPPATSGTTATAATSAAKGPTMPPDDAAAPQSAVPAPGEGDD